MIVSYNTDGSYTLEVSFNNLQLTFCLESKGITF